MLRDTIFILLLILILSIEVNAANKNNTIIDSPVYTQPQELVSVEPGRRLNIYCTGDGSPTVVLDSGLGDSTKAWGLVQPIIGAETRVCSYDRAGLGFSDPANKPGSSKNAVNDLHELLEKARVPAPYILVGHSYGGMNVKLFAEIYSSKVVGLVFVDPSHEDVGKNIFALDPAFHKVNIAYLKDLERCLDAKPDELNRNTELSGLCVGKAGPRYSDAINSADSELAIKHPRIAAWISEMRNIWRESADQVRDAYRSLGNLPIVVLTKPPSKPSPTETLELRKKKNQMLDKLYDEITGMTTNGRRIRVENTGHYIQLDQPQLVNQAIFEVVFAVRDNLNNSALSKTQQ